MNVVQRPGHSTRTAAPDITPGLTPTRLQGGLDSVARKGVRPGHLTQTCPDIQPGHFPLPL